MSHKGKMRRGEMWYKMRSNEGNYPALVADNSHRMDEIKYFLDNSKKAEPKPEVKVKKKRY